VLSRAEVFEKVRGVLQSEFEFSEEEVHPDAHLVDDLDLDSVDAVALMVRLEEETGLVLSEEDLRSLVTVQSVVDAVASRLA
jgi:acyl carrier protein